VCRAKKASLVFLATLEFADPSDLRVPVASEDRQVMMAMKGSLDLLVSPASPVPSARGVTMEGLGLAANQVQMASTVRLVKLAFKAPPACLVLLEPRATWEIVDLPVSLANPG